MIKLVDDKAGTNLPKDPDQQPRWHQVLLQKMMAGLTSQNGITVLIGLALFLALSITLSMNFVEGSRFVDQNGISRKAFYAESLIEVVDERETQRKIERARQNVPLIYQDPAPYNREVFENLHNLTEEMRSIFLDAQKTIEEKKALYEDLVGNSIAAQRIFSDYEKLHKDEKPEPSRLYWQKIAKTSDDITRKILDDGLTLNVFLEKRLDVIQGALQRYRLNSHDSQLVELLVDLSLKPNQVLDETAMEKARKKAAEDVDPVVRNFKRNEKIVGQGEAVSDVQAAALEHMGMTVRGSNWYAVFGTILLSGLFVFALWNFLYRFRGSEFYTPSHTAMISTLVALTVYALMMVHSKLNQMPIYGFPLAAVTLIITIFTHHRLGVMITTMMVFLAGLTLKIDFQILSVLLFGSLIGNYILSRDIYSSDRGQMMFAGIYVGVTQALTIIALYFLNAGFDIRGSWPDMVSDVVWGTLSGISSGVLAIGILPLLEPIFRLITPYTLIELGSHDKPLLKKMQIEAPGTFNHSLMLANLSEAAAEAIGANPLRTRVGCLYHDIGKMRRPLFFIENQKVFGVDNPHDKMTTRLSKMVILAHPRDSLEMAKQYRIPKTISAFMTEHHGTLTTGYFYNQACQEEGKENVDKDQFRYPGPKPQSKETAIAMIADACESATRALKNPTNAQIEERIQKLIDQRADDGQFDECPITFKDLKIIKDVFVRYLRGIHHTRIEYEEDIKRSFGIKIANTDTKTPDEKQDESTGKAGA